MMSATVMLYCLVFLIGVLHVQDASGAGECTYPSSPFSAMKKTEFDAMVLNKQYTGIGETILFKKLGINYEVTRNGQRTYLDNIGINAVFNDRKEGKDIAVSGKEPKNAISVCMKYANNCCLTTQIYYTVQ